MQLDPAPERSRRRATSSARRVWTTTASAAARQRQSVQSSQRMRSCDRMLCAVITTGRQRRISGQQEGVQPRREQALHVDDVGPRAGQRAAGVPSRCRGSRRRRRSSGRPRSEPADARAPTAGSVSSDTFDAGPGERRAQVPRVVRDAAPAARLDHRGLHGARIVRDEPSERSRRAHAASRADSIAARCRSTGGYLKTSAAIRASAPGTTAARRMAAAARP